MKIFKLVIFLILISIISMAVWYAPFAFKGYNSSALASHSILRARNIALTGKYATENELNVILSPDLIEKQGVESSYGSKLNSQIYAVGIKLFNLDTNAEIVLFNSFILTLALIFFSLIVYYLFDLKTAWLFALIYIFLPSNWQLSQLLMEV